MDPLARVAANRLAQAMSGPGPAVAASFVDGEPDVELSGAEASGVQVAELRIDRWSSHDAAHVLAEVQRFGNLPTLATIRIAPEGGEWTGTEGDRTGLFELVLPHVDGIDVELSAASAQAAVIDGALRRGKIVVVSFHDFEATPATARLDELVDEGKAAGADVVKLSAMSRSLDDVRRLGELTARRADDGLITIAMGEVGSLSRVFFGALGSLVTYCSGRNLVPGQLSVAETVEMIDRFYPERRARR